MIAPATRSWRALELVVAAGFLVIVAVQWHGPGFLPGTDSIAYITGGVNLIATRTFTNAAGQPELWFPPFYPILIGLTSAGGRIDPTSVAHIIAASCAVLSLFLVARITRQVGGRAHEPALAMALLALNPIHQGAALYALSEATATLLALLAFSVWLRLTDGPSVWPWVWLGLLVGLSYLTRPEGLILLPFWFAVDAVRTKARRALIARYALAAAVTVAVAFPYVIYLHEHTGRITLTGKTAINLTSGRATYFGQPTEYINPDTLEVGLWKYDVSFRDEAGRFLWNGARVVAAYARNLIAVLAPIILLGLGSFIRTRRLRFLCGGLVFVAYLVLLCVFQMKNRFLHLSLPFLSILAARGLIELWEVGRASLLSERRSAIGGWPSWTTRLVALAIVAGAVAQATVMAVRSVHDGTGIPLLREAGLQLGRLAPAGAVVYDQWGHVAFHARQQSRILTPNDVHTLLRYIDKHARPGHPVYLALSSMESGWYDPSLRPLLMSSEGFPQLRRVVAVSDAEGFVVIYEVRSQSAGLAVPD